MGEPAIKLADEANFQLGLFHISPSSNEIVHDGHRTRVEPRVMQVLVALARRPGETVSREKLLEQCWEGVAVTDDALVRCISQLRKVFAESGAEVAIDTVPKVGYRLNVASARAPISVRRSAVYKYLSAILASLALILTGVAVVVTRPHRSPSSDAVRPLSAPVTTLPGLEQWPAISPSGGQVAYSWREPEGDADIYVQAVGTDSRLQLTETEDHDYYPVWSADAGRLAFVRLGETGCGIHLVSSVGGPVSRVAECKQGGVSSMDWSPDGRYLVYSHREGALSPGRAVLIDLSDNSQQDVLTPEDPTASVEDVAFSPDGTQIAHTLVVALGVEDIYVHSLADGSTKRITFDNLKIHGFDWFPDGSGFAMSSNRGGEFSLWRVPLDGSGPTLIPGAVGGADEPKVSNQGGLVYEAWRASAEIWRLDLGSEKEPEVFLSSTRYEWDAQRSPDGQRLTFISDRSGAAEVWVSAADGSERIRLTNFGGAYTHTPRFSPDGRQIAFATPADGNFDVYVVDVDATTPRRLTTHPSEDFAPCWSPGGRSIYFGSTRSGRWQIWRFDLDDGTTHQITVNGGRAAQVSPDGRYLYYIKVDRPGLWRSELSRKGIPEERVIPNLEPVDWNNWIVLENAIYYVRRPVPSEPEIVRYDLANANTKRIRKLPALLYKSGVWVSPDESEMLFTQVATREADIMLLADVY